MNIEDGVASIEDTVEGWRQIFDYFYGKFIPTEIRGKLWASYYNSETWKAKALLVKERDYFLCQKCGSSKDLQAHHLTYDRRFCERLEDLETLCKDCHDNKHNGKKGDLIHIKLS